MEEAYAMQKRNIFQILYARAKTWEKKKERKKNAWTNSSQRFESAPAKTESVAQ